MHLQVPEAQHAVLRPDDGRGHGRGAEPGGRAVPGDTGGPRRWELACRLSRCGRISGPTCGTDMCGGVGHSPSCRSGQGWWSSNALWTPFLGRFSLTIHLGLAPHLLLEHPSLTWGLWGSVGVGWAWGGQGGGMPAGVLPPLSLCDLLAGVPWLLLAMLSATFVLLSVAGLCFVHLHVFHSPSETHLPKTLVSEQSSSGLCPTCTAAEPTSPAFAGGSAPPSLHLLRHQTTLSRCPGAPPSCPTPHTLREKAPVGCIHQPWVALEEGVSGST